MTLSNKSFISNQYRGTDCGGGGDEGGGGGGSGGGGGTDHVYKLGVN